MNREELNKLTEDYLVSIIDLNDKSDRTLIYGYTPSRITLHIYIKNKKIHTVFYKDYNNKPIDMKEITIKSNYDYIPSGGIYPETSDYEFCRLLMNCGCSLPFTGYNGGREKQQYYGFTLEDRN